MPQTLANGVPVDLEQWVQAQHQNPNRDTLVPTQVSSVKELMQRVSYVEKSVDKAKSRLQNCQEYQHHINSVCEHDLKRALQRSKANNVHIREKLTMVFGKMERLLGETGRSHEMRERQDELI